MVANVATRGAGANSNEGTVGASMVVADRRRVTWHRESVRGRGRQDAGTRYRLPGAGDQVRSAAGGITGRKNHVGAVEFQIASTGRSARERLLSIVEMRDQVVGSRSKVSGLHYMIGISRQLVSGKA